MSDLIEFNVNVCGCHTDVGALISASEAQRVIDQMQQESNQLKNRIAELERERDEAIKHLNNLLNDAINFAGETMSGCVLSATSDFLQQLRKEAGGG